MNNRIFKLHSGWRNREMYIEIYIYICIIFNVQIGLMHDGIVIH